MKVVKWITLLALGVNVSCMGLAPIYDTAITHKGLTVGGGIGYHQYEVESSSRFIHIHDGLKGIRPDLAIGYGFTNWFSVVGRAGVIIGTDIPQGNPAQEPSFGLGLKFSTPWQIFNLGLRAEADYPRLASLTPMMGFSTRKGHEIITLGIQTAFGIAPTGAFINLHPLRGSYLFVAFGENEICLGLGYTYNFSTMTKEKVIEKE
ncbi:hypothetical protein ES703_05231 [subsurface metagenome]|nr:hypothetical protein [bacterium]